MQQLDNLGQPKTQIELVNDGLIQVLENYEHIKEILTTQTYGFNNHIELTEITKNVHRKVLLATRDIRICTDMERQLGEET